ncbi:transcriptional repressor [Anaeromicropila populeti]|uniref:Fur family transcriptional regulator, ferric uptake regulator n=1 Tax=Anaeromicropila populeti TaxID=37658 RepID=A0A1I6IQK6_9FIRM|nr:transcriptional repressor [Anaeromicropila populeti]SFR68530.1 Fur family transcriptional regulator, ferric uptake regulator [Anaeromicropila populeti]
MAVLMKNQEQQFQTKMFKQELIFDELRKRGCRITSQRKIITEIILENECSCCKEIYYQAVLRDPSIGIATVYRMLNTLEEIGAINRKNMYQIHCEGFKCIENDNILVLDGNHVIEIKDSAWCQELKNRLKEKGILQNEDISFLVKIRKNEIEEEQMYG